MQPGDRVAVLLGNRLEWVELLFALARLGAVCVPVNVLLTGPEIAHVCRGSDAAYLVIDEIGAQASAGIDHDFALVVTVGDAVQAARWRGVDYAENIVDFLVEYDITHVMLVPSILRGLVTRPDLMDRLDAGPLRWVVTGSEPVPRTSSTPA